MRKTPSRKEKNYVIDRRLKNAEESVQELENVMYDFSGQSRRQRIIYSYIGTTLKVFRLNWQNVGNFYRDCRRLALESLHAGEDKIMRENEGKVPSAATSRRPSIHSTDGEDEEKTNPSIFFRSSCHSR